MSKPTNDDAAAELRLYMVENGVRDGEPMVPGINRDPKAKEFLDFWVPILGNYITTSNRQLVERLMAQMPEKQLLDWLFENADSYDAARDFGDIEGFNKAIDQVTAILTEALEELK